MMASKRKSVSVKCQSRTHIPMRPDSLLRRGGGVGAIQITHLLTYLQPLTSLLQPHKTFRRMMTVLLRLKHIQYNMHVLQCACLIVSEPTLAKETRGSEHVPPKSEKYFSDNYCVNSGILSIFHTYIFWQNVWHPKVDGTPTL